MKAQVLRKINSPLVLENWPTPIPNDDEVLIKVLTCGVCRTDLHIIDGDLPSPNLPLILGHQIVGLISALGSKVSNFKIGDRIGVPWLGGTCQKCPYCTSDRENLCNTPTFTGYQKNGGFAEYTTARADYCFPIPHNYSDLHAAPLLCAGLIGYRAYKMTSYTPETSPSDIGFYGFGSAAQILAQLVIAENKNVHAFTRPGDTQTQEIAKNLGAIWAGGSNEILPNRLDAAIIFAPSGPLIPLALKNLRKGGIVVSAEIHMSDIPSFPYNTLWNERSIRSIANLTRADGWEFLEKISNIPILTTAKEFPLEKANDAIQYSRTKKLQGTAVLRVTS